MNNLILNKQMTSDYIAQKYSEGLFPKSGDWYYPYRWITREDFIDEFDGGKQQAEMLLSQWDKQLDNNNDDINYSEEADIFIKNSFYYNKNKYYHDVIDSLMDAPIDIDNSIPVDAIDETLIPYLAMKIVEHPDNDKLRLQLNLAHISSYMYGDTQFGREWKKNELLDFFDNKKSNNPDYDVVNELQNIIDVYRDTKSFFFDNLESTRNIFGEESYNKLKDFYVGSFLDIYDNNANNLHDLLDYYENNQNLEFDDDNNIEYQEQINFYELADEEQTMEMTEIIDNYADSIFGSFGFDFEHIFELMIEYTKGMPNDSYLGRLMSEFAQRIPDNISPLSVLSVDAYVENSNSINSFLTIAGMNNEDRLAYELPNSRLTQDIMAMDSIFSNIEKNENETILYRGIKYQGVWDGIIDAIEEGDGSYQNDAFISTSIDKNVADNFADYGMLRFNIPPKTVRMLDIHNIIRSGLSAGEQEFLLPRGTILEFKMSEETIPRGQRKNPLNDTYDEVSIPIVDVNIISDNENYGISSNIINSIPALFDMGYESREEIVSKMNEYKYTLKNESDEHLINNTIEIIKSIDDLNYYVDDTLLFSEDIKDNVNNELIPIIRNLKENFNVDSLTLQKIRNGFLRYIHIKEPGIAKEVFNSLKNYGIDSSGEDLFKSIQKNQFNILNDNLIYINDDEFKVIIPDDFVIGLGGYDSIDNNQCALFYLPQIKRENENILFTMDGMLFPLDFVCIDSNGYIISMDKNIQPEPNTLIYMPYNSHIVLEMNAGVSDNYNIGDIVYNVEQLNKQHMSGVLMDNKNVIPTNTRGGKPTESDKFRILAENDALDLLEWQGIKINEWEKFKNRQKEKVKKEIDILYEDDEDDIVSLYKTVTQQEVAAARNRGLVPQSGDEMNPVRWVTPEEQDSVENNNNEYDMEAGFDAFTNSGDNNIDINDIDEFIFEPESILDMNYDKLENLYEALDNANEQLTLIATSDNNDTINDIKDNNDRIKYFAGGIVKYTQKLDNDNFNGSLNNFLNGATDFVSYLDDMINYFDEDEENQNKIKDYKSNVIKNIGHIKEEIQHVKDNTIHYDAILNNINENANTYTFYHKQNLLNDYILNSDEKKYVYDNNKKIIDIINGLNYFYFDEDNDEGLMMDDSEYYDDLEQNINNLKELISKMDDIKYIAEQNSNIDFVNGIDAHIASMQDILAEKEEDNAENSKIIQDKIDFFDNSFDITKQLSYIRDLYADVKDADERETVHFMNFSLKNLEESINTGQGIRNYEGIKENGILRAYAKVTRDHYDDARVFNIDIVSVMPSEYKNQKEGMKIGYGVKMMINMLSKFVESDDDYAQISPLNDHVGRGYEKFGFKYEELDRNYMTLSREDAIKSMKRFSKLFGPYIKEMEEQGLIKSLFPYMEEKYQIMHNLYSIIYLDRVEHIPIINKNSSLYGKNVILYKNNKNYINFLNY